MTGAILSSSYILTYLVLTTNYRTLQMREQLPDIPKSHGYLVVELDSISGHQF